MKITHIDSHIVHLPADEPLAGGPTVPGAVRKFVTLTIGTDEGVEGVGITFFGFALTPALKVAVDALGELTIGENPLQIDALVKKLRSAAGTCGPGGILPLALAAIDIALWDIKGKVLGLPLAKLLGASRDRVPTYASGALERRFSLDQVAKAGAKLVADGFRQMKMHLALLGETSAAREIECVRVIREAVGEDIELMCDFNQRWDLHQAISIGRRIEQYHLSWLEDIIAHDDYVGLARVANALDTPLCSGEYLYGVTPFRHMLEARSVDIVMIDLLRAGGISEWLKIANLAAAFNLPIVSHVLPEIHVHLIAAMAHGLTVEYMPWTLSLFKEVPRPVNGQLAVPTKPGLGLAFDRETIKRYGV